MALAVQSVFAQTVELKPQAAKWSIADTCREIDRVSKKYDLPRATFTRLIWTESRFDIKAISPKGAQGIAQFMPATAKERGLENPYNPKEALEASASLLFDLRAQFGNFGLAAMAYNAGPRRVSNWLSKEGGLPFETRDYIAALTGQSAETFKSRTAQVIDFSLKKGQPFAKSCAALPVMKTRAHAVGGVAVKRQPWGVQVAGNFSRNRAMRSWTRVRSKLRLAIGDAKPQLHRVRGLRGMKSKWAVRIGAPSRKKAISICKKIRTAGGFCLVRKN